MAGSANSRRRVYVTCRPIFSGSDAHVRKPKKVKELVNKSRKSLQPLLKDLGESKLIEILRSLLEARIFESEIRAKVEFPDLFRPSAARDIQRQASEADAVRSTAEALDEIVSQEGEGLEKLEEAVESEASVIENGPDIAPEPSSEKRILPDKLPSLYPSYLPYQTQHIILNTTQQVLEECCFDFAKASMPSILNDNKWDCPAAVELTQWTKIFRKGKGGLRTVAADFNDKELQQLLKEVSNVRHTAVHRLPTTARGISQLLESAVSFVQALQDDLRAAQLEELRSDVNSKIKAMELNKNVLEDAASSQLQQIQRQREELDRMEARLIKGLLQDDSNNKVLIGQLLEDSVREIFSLDSERGKKRNEEKEGGDDEGEDEEDEEESEAKQDEGDQAQENKVQQNENEEGEQ